MRHIENYQLKPASSKDFNLVKPEYFDSIDIAEEEIPNLLLDSKFIPKGDFQSDDESLLDEKINLKLEDSDSNDEFDSIVKNEVRRNRRKAVAPQRAIQLELSQGGSIENSSESSQDISETLESNFNIPNGMNKTLTNILSTHNMINSSEADDLMEYFNEDDIFKDIEQEADGEKLDEEIIDSVKDEWRAQWGIKCNMCEQVFPFKNDFDKHYKSSYQSPPIYTCTFCNKTAEKYSTFRSHCYRHISEGKYKCEECPKAFSLQSMLHVHVLAKHGKAKPFMCEECGKSFVTRPGLRIHLKKHNNETAEDYPCVECGKVLHTRGGLTSHMNVHRLGRRFMCDVCGKTFTQKVNMQQHVKQHTGDKPYSCDQCGKTFTERSHLARHYSFHSNVRPFKCKVCQKMYKTERCLKVHSLVHAESRPFVCDYCNKGFLSSTKLKQHCNIHTGERPFACKYCERTFTNYPNWLKHIRRRHKVDHKTGAHLEPKAGQEEPPATLPPLVPAPPPPVETPPSSEPLLEDLSLTKTEEMFLQQGLLNFPLIDDKFMFPQQMDIGSASANSMGLITPYFQSPLPNHQTIIPHNASTMLPITTLSDMLHTAYVPQHCD